jgi:CBS domain-containing protein
VEKKSLLKASFDSAKVKIRGWIKKSPILREDTDVLEAAYHMYNNGTDYLPVEKDKKIIGVVNGLDLAKLASTLPEMKHLKLKDIKLLRPAMVQKDDTLAKAINLMYDYSLDHLPVFDGAELSGVLSFRDFIRQYLNWSPKRDYSARFNTQVKMKMIDGDSPKMESLPVSNFSTQHNLVTVPPSIGLKEALSQMYQKNISDLLIVEKEKFLGVFTVQNVLKQLGTLRPPVEFTISFVGLKEAGLKPFQKEDLQVTAGAEAQRLQRKVKVPLNFRVHLKEHGKKEEGREKYSVVLRLEAGKQVLTSSYDDWNLDMVLKNAFYRLEEEITKKIGKQSTKDKKVRFAH